LVVFNILKENRMKKIAAMCLGLSLIAGSVAPVFAADKTDTTKTKKKKKANKKTDTTSTEKKS